MWAWLTSNDRWWFWLLRLAGLGLAIQDSLDGGIEDFNAVVFYLALMLGPEVIKLDLRNQGGGK